jgi:putative FmdB family regulatory protein
MPTYEYECPSCDHEFEQFQSMKDDPLKKCPKCGVKKLKRLVGGGAGLIFKGTGFYITDYKKKSGGESKAGESKTSSGDTKTTSGEAKVSAPSTTTTASKPATQSAKKSPSP